MIAIYHDGPESTPGERLRSDAAIVVPDNAAIPRELRLYLNDPTTTPKDQLHTEICLPVE